MYNICIIILLAVVQLYPYGPSSGDETLIGADSSSGLRFLGKPIHFYGQKHNQIAVSWEAQNLHVYKLAQSLKTFNLLHVRVFFPHYRSTWMATSHSATCSHPMCSLQCLWIELMFPLWLRSTLTVTPVETEVRPTSTTERHLMIFCSTEQSWTLRVLTLELTSVQIVSSSLPGPRLAFTTTTRIRYALAIVSMYSQANEIMSFCTCTL